MDVRETRTFGCGRFLRHPEGSTAAAVPGRLPRPELKQQKNKEGGKRPGTGIPGGAARDDMNNQEKIDFCNAAIPLLQEKFGEGVEFKTNVAYQSNSARIGVAMILPRMTDLCPGAYLDRLPENCTLQEFVDYAVIQFQETMKGLPEVRRAMPRVDMSREGILNNVILQTLSPERNQGMLKDNLHIRFLDLVGVFRLPAESDIPEHKNTFMSTLLPNVLLESTGLTIEEIYEAAKRNTLRKYGIQMFSIIECTMRMMAGMDFHTWKPEPFRKVKMNRMGAYVVTNQMRLNGSSLILIPKVLEDLAKKAGSDYYIVPSSIHEFQVQRVREAPSASELKQIIYDVNRNSRAIKPEEILNDSLYRYSVRKKRLTIV